MGAVTLLGAATVLAANDSDSIGPGWWGLIVFLGLAVAVIVLYKSMNRHMRRVPKAFDDAPPPADKAPRT